MKIGNERFYTDGWYDDWDSVEQCMAAEYTHGDPPVDALIIHKVVVVEEIRYKLGEDGEYERVCMHPDTVDMRSLNKRVCSTCGVKFEWNLKDGEQPLHTSSRDKG